jgi:putative oxidoreductase
MQTLIGLLINLPERLAAHFYWLPPLTARITVGWVFLWSGGGKLNDLPTVTANFIDWGIPFPHILTPFVCLVSFSAGSYCCSAYLRVSPPHPSS